MDGTMVWVPPGHRIYIWPATDTRTTEIIEDLNIERGRE